MKVKCAVPCRGRDGTPLLLFTRIDVTKNQYNHGEHYEMAAYIADGRGFEVTRGVVIFDEFDYPELMTLHNWE